MLQITVNVHIDWGRDVVEHDFVYVGDMLHMLSQISTRHLRMTFVRNSSSSFSRIISFTLEHLHVSVNLHQSTERNDVTITSRHASTCSFQKIRKYP